MRYFSVNDGTVYGFDDQDAAQLPAMQAIIDGGADEITQSWPPLTTAHVPEVITPRQGMIILSRSGLLGGVMDALASMTGQAAEEAKIDFERASEWRRDWPLLNSLASGLGLSDNQIDQMFVQASEIQ